MAASALLFLSESALAQQLSVEEIIVTARKREESLQNIPLSITAFTRDQIENLAIADISDIAKITPGLTFDRGIAQSDLRPAIRGLQAERGRTSVGILIDDIDITSENLQNPGGGTLARTRLVDVERIEVVKGPQAALFGRAAFGGAINYITKRPSLTETEFRGLAEVHSESGFDLRASAGTPLVEDKVGVRMNAYYWDERGSYRNELSGDHVGGGDGVGVAGGFTLQATESLSFYDRLEYSDEHIATPAAYLNLGNSVINLDANAQTVLNRPTVTILPDQWLAGQSGTTLIRELEKTTVGRI